MTLKSLSLAAALVLVAGIALVAAVLLAGRDDNPDDALQAALSTTCDPALTRYFDVTVDLDGELASIRYDGTDYHMTSSTPNGLREEIRKGNTVYTRRSAADDWTTSTDSSSFIGICGPASSTSSTRWTETGDPSYAYGGLNFNFMGTVTLNGETVRHYISDPIDSSTRSDQGSAYDGSTEELWIDSSNYIVQLRRNLIINIMARNYSTTATITIRLSGLGEVNTITAPVLPMPTA